MIANSLRIIIFCYAVSIGLLSIEVLLLVPLGMELRAPDGTPMKASMIGLLSEDRIKDVATNIRDTNFSGESADGNIFSRIFDFNVSAAYSVFQLVQILSGTYVFSLLLVVGFPAILVVGMVMIYTIFLAVTIVSLLRGISFA